MSKGTKVLPDRPGYWIAREGDTGKSIHHVVRVEFAEGPPWLAVFNSDCSTDSVHIYEWIGPAEEEDRP